MNTATASSIDVRTEWVGTSPGRILLLTVLMALVAALLVVPASPSQAQTGGPLVLTGIDAEDCGPGGHGPIGNYVTLVNDGILANTTNSGDGILVIGANGSGPQNFWNAIGTGTGENVTFGDENSDLSGFQMVGVVGSAPETCSGLTQAQNNVLETRQADFTDFVNNGGGLLGNTQADFVNQYAYLSAVGTISSATFHYDNIDPTPAGEAVGVTDDLDVCCWHNVFTAFPAFLEVLAFPAGTTHAAAIGGQNVVLPSGITLDPATAQNPAGSDHTVTATVTDGEGNPLPGELVSFSVTAGPNAGEASDPATGECSPDSCETDATGEVAWTYTSNGAAGTDDIEACFDDDDGTERCATATKEWVTQQVDIDIKPGSDPNSINLRNRGVIPVAILTTDTFDATTVDPASVCFGDAEEPTERDCTEAHGTGHVEDVDGDGDDDLVLHFQTQETGIDPGDTEACLTGTTTGGTAIEGCDSVRTVPTA